MGCTQVCIVQPVVPAYRVGFFRRLAQTPSLDLEIHAAERMPDGAIATHPSAKGLPIIFHPIRHRFGCYWLKDLRLPSEFACGDVVVLWGAVQHLNNYLLWLQARRRKVGVVWWGQGYTAATTRRKANLKKWVAGFADSILLYTEREAEIYRKAGFAKPLFGANNCLDDEIIRNAMAGWPPPRVQQFRVSERLVERKVILFCGRLSGKGGVATLLQALLRLRTEDPSYLLLVIGDGADRLKLQELASDLGVESHVRWLGAIYEESVLAPWFLSAHCFVYPGAIGLSLIHAFNYGVPVITHGNVANHMPEIAGLEAGRNGLLFREADPQDLVEKIRLVCTDDALRERLSQGAFRTIRERFNMDHMVAQMVGAIEAASAAVTGRGVARAGFGVRD